MRNIYLFWGALLLVDGVFGDDETVTLSVMKGDSVTLKPPTELKQGDSAQWLFDGKRIADTSKAVGNVDEIFKDRLNLDQTTGSLTITNITTDHAGLYKLHILSKKETPDHIFNVTVHDVVKSLSVMEGDTVTLHTGVTGKVKTVPVKEGESVFLHTGVTEIQEYDLIILKFGDHHIAEINKGKFKANGASADGRFKDRLLMPPNIVSFAIIGSRITDTGDYHLNMSRSSHTVQRNISVTVSGVFGFNETLSVMEGDSVTLKPPTELKQGDSAQWWFDGKRIADTSKAVGNVDERFKDRLNLDQTTGSLTITNIRTDHAGLYKLHISSKKETPDHIFRVTVRDVVVSVSVVEGDTVTLHTGVTGIQRDEIQWKFGGVLIADLNRSDASWSNTDLNDQTGDLTIRNIRRNQFGDYEVKMKNKNSLMFRGKFRISTLGVFGDDVTLSVMKGDSVTLKPPTVITEDDTTLWLFGKERIARMNKAAGLFSSSEDDGRFKGKLELDHQTGSLTIKNLKTEDTGFYKLWIRGNTETFKIFSVTVSDSGLSPGAVAGIVVGLLLLLVFVAAAAGVIYHRHKISKLQRSRDVNGTNDPLKVTANSDDL